MDKKATMKKLLFPLFVKNTMEIEEINKSNYDEIYNNVKLDLMLYTIKLENLGLSKEEIIIAVNNYKSEMFDSLDSASKDSLILNTIKTLRKV